MYIHIEVGREGGRHREIVIMHSEQIVKHHSVQVEKTAQEKGTDISEKPLRASKIVLIAAFIVLELFSFYGP